MTKPASVQEQLLGHLLGALDDGEEQAVAARLRSDPDLREQLQRVGLQLEPLSAGVCDFLPPPGLAERTCRFVAAHGKLPAAAGSRRRSMSADAAPLGWIGRIRWTDVAVAAVIFAAASLLIVPAILSSRFDSRVAVCRDNLRDLGRALTQYSERHGDYFPPVPTEGRLAGAGIYAPVLLCDGLLTDFSRVVCPGSALAEVRDFGVPSIDELQTASAEEAERLRHRMGGSYGYNLGHMQDGVYHATKNLRRGEFALMADGPGADLPGHQSPNHGGRGQNVLLEDGSVQYYSSPRPYPEADHIYANDDGIVAAGTHLNDSVIGSSSAVPIIYVSNH